MDKYRIIRPVGRGTFGAALLVEDVADGVRGATEFHPADRSARAAPSPPPRPAGDLAQTLRDARGKPVAEEVVLDWFVQICLALMHMHDRRVMHRDLKTQNIFLTKVLCVCVCVCVCAYACVCVCVCV